MKEGVKMEIKEIIELLEKDRKVAREEWNYISEINDPVRENYLNGKMNTLDNVLFLLKKVGV